MRWVKTQVPVDQINKKSLLFVSGKIKTQKCHRKVWLKIWFYKVIPRLLFSKIRDCFIRKYCVTNCKLDTDYPCKSSNCFLFEGFQNFCTFVAPMLSFSSGSSSQGWARKAGSGSSLCSLKSNWAIYEPPAWLRS